MKVERVCCALALALVVASCDLPTAGAGAGAGGGGGGGGAAPSRAVVAQVTGPTSMTGRRSSDRVTCDIVLQAHVSGGNTPGAYARWGSATVTWAKLATAQTGSAKWDTDNVSAFWNRPVTFVGETHSSIVWSTYWDEPFMVTFDFAYLAARDGELNPTVVRRVQHTVSCE